MKGDTCTPSFVEMASIICTVTNICTTSATYILRVNMKERDTFVLTVKIKFIKSLVHYVNYFI